MKRTLTILILTGVCFLSCQKDSVEPGVTAEPGITISTKSDPKTVSPVTSNNQSAVSNDTTKGYLRVQVAKDSVNTDAVLIQFTPSATAAFSNAIDARTFKGFGEVSLSSLTSDNVACAINTLPLLSQGTTIGLVVNATTTDIYKLNLATIQSIPANINIWLKDKYKKDSLDFRKYPSYSFNLNLSDTSTYGSNRFSIVLRAN